MAEVVLNRIEFQAAQARAEGGPDGQWQLLMKMNFQLMQPAFDHACAESSVGMVKISTTEAGVFLFEPVDPRSTPGPGIE